MRPINTIFMALALSLSLAACTTSQHAASPGNLRPALALVRAGNRTIEGASAARVFGIPKVNCTETAFDKIISHDEQSGCLLCISFDVTPLDGCRFDVRTIYLSVSGQTREEAAAEIQRYVEMTMPASSSKESEHLPGMQRVLYRNGATTYETHVTVARAKSVWVCSAVVFKSGA